MAKKLNNYILPITTIIEVIATKENEIPIKKEMTFGEALKLESKNGWTYQNFQLGFSAFKTTK